MKFNQYVSEGDKVERPIYRGFKAGDIISVKVTSVDYENEFLIVDKGHVPMKDVVMVNDTPISEVLKNQLKEK